MKTNRDDVRGTHAAIYSSTNGLVSSPPLPSWIESRSKGRKILSMETRTEENDGKNCSAALWGSYVRTYVRIHLLLPIHPPLLSSKRLGLFPSNKVRPGKKEADADPLTRNGHIPRPCRPSVAFFFPSSARHAHPLRTYVRAHSAGIFQRNARARTPFRESWREKRVSGGRSRGGGGGRGGRGPGCACRVV